MGSGRPKTSDSIKWFFEKRAKSLKEAATKAAAETVISDSDDPADSSSVPTLGGCLVDPGEAAGKALFGFEVGETLVLKFLGGQDKEFKKFKNAIFKCAVVKYFVKKTQISSGKLVNSSFAGPARTYIDSLAGLAEIYTACC